MKNILKNALSGFFNLFKSPPKWPDSLSEYQRDHLRQEFGGPRVTITGSAGHMSNGYGRMWESGTITDVFTYTGMYSIYTNQTCYTVILDNDPHKQGYYYLRRELSHEQSKPIPPIPDDCEHFSKPKDQAERVKVQLHKIAENTSISKDMIKVDYMFSKNVEEKYHDKTVEIRSKMYNRHGGWTYADKDKMFIQGKPSWGTWHYCHCPGSIQESIDVSDCADDLDVLNKSLPHLHKFLFPDEYPLSPKAELAFKNTQLSAEDIKSYHLENDKRELPPSYEAS